VFNVFMDCPLLSNLGAVKPSLIDSDAAMPTRRKDMIIHRERLSEKALHTWSDAIVRSVPNQKVQKPTEMIGSGSLFPSNKRRFGAFLDGLALPVGGY